MNKRGILTIVAIFGGLFLVMLVFIASLMVAFGDGFGAGEGIGVIEVDGPISESKKIVADIRRFADDDSIKGVVVRVDSPGGAVAPSQEIYEAVRWLRDRKPVAVSMGTTAASGGYYIACGSDMIFANAGTITGSIGVITQFFNLERVLEHVDVQVHTVTTGAMKDAGSPFREFNAADEAFFRGLIGDIHEQFVADVAACRGLELAEAHKLADGRVFTGRQAKELNLVDEVGTLHDAIAHVAGKAGIKGEPKVVYPPRESGGFIAEMLRAGINTGLREAKVHSAPRVQYLYVGPQ